ncbi:hypothetical protein ACWC5C_28180 [Streptomyces sp. NPDC001700]
MQTLRPGRYRPAAALLILVGLSLTACGEQRVTASDTPSARPTSSTSASPAPPYVEPGIVDGAPHYGENNAHRQPREMSPASARDAQKEADRIKPVLKRLWDQKKWAPKTVRAALLDLGYEEERTGPKGERLGGTLTVQGLGSRYEGARVSLRVHEDACVTAYLQKTNFQVTANGPYLETGCFMPPSGH